MMVILGQSSRLTVSPKSVSKLDRFGLPAFVANKIRMSLCYLLKRWNVCYLLLWARLGPELQQAFDDLFSEGCIFLKDLDDTVGQLGVVEREAAHLVKRYQHLAQELFVFRLQRQGEAVDDAPEDLEQLAHAVEVFSFVNEPENVWRGFSTAVLRS